jgi:hypothetical protein
MERFEHFVRTQVSGLDELLAPATIDADDFLAYQSLPYRCSRYMGRGWGLVGDAGSFMDPYYSPGLDHASMSVWATVQLIRRDFSGELGETQLDAAIAKHNQEFYDSYDRWVDALYTDKYETMGDAELTAAGFLMDTGMYYLGVVINNAADLENLRSPAFGSDVRGSRWAHWAMVTFKRRLVKLARFRRAVGTYGKRNLGWRYYPIRFDVTRRRSLQLVQEALAIWWRVEREYLAHRLLLRGKVDLSPPRPLGDDAPLEERAPLVEAAIAAVAP